METEDTEVWGGTSLMPNEDSGSAYEESEEEQAHGSSQNDEPNIARSSRANSTTRRGRSKSRKRKALGSSPDQNQDVSESDGEKSRDSSTASQREERHRAAEEWAATFEAPQSPTDIRDPIRRAAGTRSKRKAAKPPSEVRAKRLKSWYNNEYRELLNVEIHDAVARSIAEDQMPLEASQIGCSMWTVKEKDMFFSALSRLGRDNVRQIASRIGSRSELEVQEYIYLLHQGMLEKSNKLLGLTDLPAAIEISDECCGLLERAGDALASRQERAEEEVEQEKWGDICLLNQATNRQFEGQQKDGSARNHLHESFSAANFFHLSNWLELSRRVFMNPDIEEDNWETIAEPGETPAVRATAFEDFHSLAVNITKRLISTTLFCTMSRQRATGARTIKHAEVNRDDVEAAVKILGLKPISQEFWKGCARRCNLKVFDEEWNSFMSYEEVETALRETKERSRSRSVSRRERSVSRAAQSVVDTEDLTDSPPSEDYGSDDSLYGYEYDFTNGASDSEDCVTKHLTDGEACSKSHKEKLLEKARATKDAEHAHEKYVEAFDQEASHGEEIRLWTLLRQTAPFDIQPEPRDLPEQPKGMFKDDVAEAGNWRDHVEYRSQWETLDTPVLREHFERNRKWISRRAKRRIERARSSRDLTTENSEDDEDVASSIDSDEDRNEDYENAHEHLVEGEDSQETEDQGVSQKAAMKSENETDQARHNAEDDFENQTEHQDEGNDLYERHVGYENEDIDSSDFGKEQSSIPQSPTSVDALSGHCQRDSEERQGSDEEIRIKDEYESDS